MCTGKEEALAGGWGKNVMYVFDVVLGAQNEGQGRAGVGEK